MKEVYRTKMTESGRILIPAELRRVLGTDEGEELILVRDLFDDSISITTGSEMLRRVQSVVREFIPDPSIDLTAEVINARKSDGSFS